MDARLAGRMAALREQADERRAEHRRAARAALAAMRGRGETVREIARMAGIGEKTARELMRLVSGAPARLAGVAASAAGETRVSGAAETVSRGDEAARTPDVGCAPAEPGT